MGRRSRFARVRVSVVPSGFLLIEAVMAMAILVIVTVGVYKIMEAALQTTVEVRRNHLRDQETNGVVELIRRALRGLPGDALVYSRVTQDAGRTFPGLVIEQSPSAFSFGANSFHFGPQVLEVRPQIGGLFSLSLILEPELTSTGQPVSNEDPLPPVELIRDIRSLEWRFYDERTEQWVQHWEDATIRPRLIQLTLGLAGNTNPTVAVFLLPVKSDVQLPSGGGRRRNNPQLPPPNGVVPAP